MYAASDKKVDETKIDPIQDVDLPAAAQADVAVPNLALTSLPPMTESERCSLEKRLKRKIDTRLLCPLVVLYILNYLDRNNLSQAADYGFKRDLHLVGNQYSTILAILFVGYILFQVRPCCQPRPPRRSHRRSLQHRLCPRRACLGSLLTPPASGYYVPLRLRPVPVLITVHRSPPTCS